MKHYIYAHQPFDLDKGGSIGYISYLYDAYLKYNSNFITENNIKISFVFPEENIKNNTLSSVLDQRVAYTQSYLQPSTKHLLIQRQNWFKEIIPELQSNKIDAQSITSIHIHGAYNFFPIYNYLCKLGIESKVIKMLTTHNPYQPMIEDMYLTCRTVKWLECDKQMFKYYFNERDKWAFTLADCLFFPTEESMEGYYQSWPDFKNIIKNKSIYFATTGSAVKNITQSPEAMRKQLNIPNDAKVLLYMGRFIDIRGFDILIEAANNILNKYNNIYFVIVGENIEMPIKSKYWIQLPFTKDPGSFINMADACLCPNRGSFFDLSMIEILSLGKPIICSYVGGYKWLKDKTSGVIYAKAGDAVSFQKAIENFIEKKYNIVDNMCKDNFKLYNKSLTLYNFEKGYSKAIDEMYSEFYNSERIYKLSSSKTDNMSRNCIKITIPKKNFKTKKLKKLIRHPVLFIKDFISKRMFNAQ